MEFLMHTIFMYIFNINSHLLLICNAFVSSIEMHVAGFHVLINAKRWQAQHWSQW